MYRPENSTEIHHQRGQVKATQLNVYILKSIQVIRCQKKNYNHSNNPILHEKLLLSSELDEKTVQKAFKCKQQMMECRNKGKGSR